MIAFPLRNLQCLKTNEVTNPKMRPTVSDTTPSMINCPKITKGVAVVKVTVYNCKTVLNRIIETISLTTPSPKMQLYSFGCWV